MSISSTNFLTQAARQQQCAGPGCNRAVERRARGRQRRFCSDLCQKRAYRRGGIFGQETAAAFPTVGPDHLVARTALCAKTVHFRTSEINDLETPSARGSARIIGPRDVIHAEIVAGRDWDQVVSTAGVVTYVSRLRERALVEECVL